jgi:hypothetical protein
MFYIGFYRSDFTTGLLVPKLSVPAQIERQQRLSQRLLQMGAEEKVAVMTQVQLYEFEIELKFSDRMKLR